MFWMLDSIETINTDPLDGWAGQWILHRHRDHYGPHLDLRLEFRGILGGLRVDADALIPGVPATEKGPHPNAWLTAEGPAQEVGRGRWAWEKYTPDHRVLLLDNGTDRLRLGWKRAPALPTSVIVQLAAWAQQNHLTPDQLSALCADGLRARQAARARCRGLAALIEAEHFDPDAWNDLLEPLNLDALNQKLDALEARLDQLHPPAPWTHPPDATTETPEHQDPRAFTRAITLLHEVSNPHLPRNRTAHPLE